MPNRPYRDHYNQDDSEDNGRAIEDLVTGGRRNIALLRETPLAIFGAWSVRVVVMAVVLWLVNHFFGPYAWVWWVLLAYAVISLGTSLGLNMLKNRQLDRIEQLYDRDQHHR